MVLKSSGSGGGRFRKLDERDRDNGDGGPVGLGGLGGGTGAEKSAVSKNDDVRDLGI